MVPGRSFGVQAAFRREKEAGRRELFPHYRLRLLALAAVTCGAITARAQSFDKARRVFDNFDVQMHGYATQSFLFTTQNNIFAVSSSDGSLKWTDGVVNISGLPTPRLRFGAQGRYFLLGRYSNAVSLDWAQADYKFNDRFGLRAGKVKTPSGLYNEVQDIDTAFIWALLPQSVYPITSRNSLLAHSGAVIYGSLGGERHFGKLDYRGWGGQRVVSPNDGYFLNLKEAGVRFPDGLRGPLAGAALHWKPPLHGLMIGASDIWESTWKAKLTAGYGAVSGTNRVAAFHSPGFFVRYERNNIAIASEYARFAPRIKQTFPGLPPTYVPLDNRNWYVMASYKVTARFTTGAYFSEQINQSVALGPSRFSKDWALAGRYEFNQSLYAKFEQHFIDGTAIGYDTALNPNGLKPDTRLTILKIGVSY